MVREEIRRWWQAVCCAAHDAPVDSEAEAFFIEWADSLYERLIESY